MPNSPQAATIWKEQEATASDGTPLAWLGSWVAISGRTAFVSAKNATVAGQPSQGAVYVFDKSGSGWQQRQKLVGKGSAAGDQFGAGVALHGNTAFITAPTAAVGDNIWQGVVHVFTRSGTADRVGWSDTQVLTASDGTRFATFGTAVAFDGDYAFVGAGGANSQGEYQPRKVYVFRRSSHTGDWVQTQILENPMPADVTNSFGAALAVSGDVLLVGARGATLGGNIGQGVVFPYRLKNGTWLPDGKISDAQGAARDNFGVSIALQGHTALIGAQGAVVDGNQGTVYRYERDRSGWRLVQKIVPTASDSARPALFGALVSMSGDTALVGAYAEKDYRGAAYLFKLKSGMYAQHQRLSASDGVPGDVFGYYGALDGASAAIGAYTKKVGSNAQEGVVYFYDAHSFGASPAAHEA